MSGRQTVTQETAEATPPCDVEFAAPDLSPWRAGNTGVEGFWRFDGPAPGPNVTILALVHGNEIGGAVVLDRLLRAGPSPLRGSLTLGLVNFDAYARFDPAQPTASRYADEDFNRLWEAEQLDGARQSLELARARAIRPLIEQADLLLDLHSMLWPSDPLILCGPTERGRALAERIGTPPMVVADRGHASGKRLIDYAPFVEEGSARAAVLLEAGQHWRLETVATMEESVASLLAATGLAPPARPRATASRFADVTMAVTAATGGFSFVRAFRGGEVVPARGTLIAIDGETEIRTPHDDCLLVMPSLRAGRGHTAVRLARFR